MNKIEKELISKGWINTRIDKDISCGSWPEKHIRITMWDSNKPTNFDIQGNPCGYEYADGDGATIKEAFEHLKRNIDNGYCRYFPQSYTNPVDKDYKKWKVAQRKKKTKKSLN